MNARLSSDNSKSAFSLIELLVVIAIIGIIGSFAVPAVGNLLKGSSMTQAANILTDQCAAARQISLTRNRSVEVRFYRFWNPENPGEDVKDDLDKSSNFFPDGAPYRAVQFFEIAEGGIPNPTGKLMRFPDTVVMTPKPALSSILNLPKSPPAPNDPDLPRGVGRNYAYVAFRFLPDGATSLPLTGGTSSGKWFITAHLQSDLPKVTGTTPPPNFFTWMIDPVSGSTKVLRPGVK